MTKPSTQMQRLLAAAFLAGVPFAAHAQNKTVTPPEQGTVAAQGNVVGPADKPQAGVPVEIVGPPGKTIAITDKSGTWSVYNLPAGEYQVKAIDVDKGQAMAPVTFSVKEPSFWSRFTSGGAKTVQTPSIKLDSASR